MSGRNIVVDDQKYRWTRGRRDGNELLSAWIDGNHRAILQIQFVHPYVNREYQGHPDFDESVSNHTQGFVDSGVRSYNLNRPAVAAGLIRLAQAYGWEPLGRQPLTLDGFALLREHGSELAYDRKFEPWRELATQLLEHRAAVAGQPPLAWLRTHTSQSWGAFNYDRPLPMPSFTLASVLEFDLWLDQPSTLTAPQLAELTVWADAQQSRAQPGGLALAGWLARGSVSYTAELDDLRWWCEALLARPSPP